MAASILQSNKAALLRGAARRGVGPLARQAGLTAADTLLRRKHLVFYAAARDVLSVPDAGSMDFREIPSMDAMPEDLRSRLMDGDDPADWGEPGWFDRGWRLWVGEIDGCVACLGWLRSAAQSRDFFYPMPEDTELLWQMVTLPEFRGRGLHVTFRLALMRARLEEGVVGFFINCREYNSTSHRNILKMGFHPVGHCTDSRITGRRSWHPTASIDGTT